jgi:hypothetical protein
MSLLGKLRAASLAVEAPTDTWLAPLQRVRGKAEFDGLERVTRQTLLDILQVPNRSQHSWRLPAPGEADGRVGLDSCE